MSQTGLETASKLGSHSTVETKRDQADEIGQIHLLGATIMPSNRELGSKIISFKSFKGIPADLWKQILTFLSAKDLAYFARTCVPFRALINKNKDAQWIIEEFLDQPRIQAIDNPATTYWQKQYLKTSIVSRAIRKGKLSVQDALNRIPQNLSASEMVSVELGFSPAEAREIRENGWEDVHRRTLSECSLHTSHRLEGVQRAKIEENGDEQETDIKDEHDQQKIDQNKREQKSALELGAASSKVAVAKLERTIQDAVAEALEKKYLEIKGLQDFQVEGIRLGLTREQVVSNQNFSPSHVKVLEGLRNKFILTQDLVSSIFTFSAQQIERIENEHQLIAILGRDLTWGALRMGPDLKDIQENFELFLKLNPVQLEGVGHQFPICIAKNFTSTTFSDHEIHEFRRCGVDIISAFANLYNDEVRKAEQDTKALSESRHIEITEKVILMLKGLKNGPSTYDYMHRLKGLQLGLTFEQASHLDEFNFSERKYSLLAKHKAANKDRKEIIAYFEAIEMLNPMQLEAIDVYGIPAEQVSKVDISRDHLAILSKLKDANKDRKEIIACFDSIKVLDMFQLAAFVKYEISSERAKQTKVYSFNGVSYHDHWDQLIKKGRNAALIAKFTDDQICGLAYADLSEAQVLHENYSHELAEILYWCPDKYKFEDLIKLNQGQIQALNSRLFEEMFAHKGQAATIEEDAKRILEMAAAGSQNASLQNTDAPSPTYLPLSGLRAEASGSSPASAVDSLKGGTKPNGSPQSP